MAEMLVPHSFPVKSHQDEVDIACLKQRDTVVCGYELGLLFSISDQSQYGHASRLESLQIFGRQFTYLPFDLVAKIARAFLGDKHLSLTEVPHTKTGRIDEKTRNIYVWTLYRDGDGAPIPSPYKDAVTKSHGEFKFYKINPEQISFF